ncbi:GYDIA family GHMP kinase [Wandonia haliotis]
MIVTETKTYRASGKLMLFGEYMVLKGAPCLAIPLHYGQTLQVEEISEPGVEWKSFELNDVWFTTRLDTAFNSIETSDQEKSEVLVNLLNVIRKEKPELFETGLRFKAQSDFNLQWGLGSSSTLVSLLAQWSGVNPYRILEETFGGSGYDIACATAVQPILYEVAGRKTQEVELPESVTSNFLFVYSGNKQNSRNEIKRFNKRETAPEDVKQIQEIITQSLRAETISDFEKSLSESENLLSEILGMQTLKQERFSDYPFEIKSLGAWGGDFFLATFREEEQARAYFLEKGYDTMFTYRELIFR